MTTQTNTNQLQAFDEVPPPEYAPPPDYVAATTNPNTVISQQSVGEFPTRVKCPLCSAEILTSTHYKSGCMTWAICGGLCAAGLFIPCVWLGCQFIPFCVDDCKDVIHSCPNCGANIGRYDRVK